MAGKWEYRLPRLTRAYAEGRRSAFVGGSSPHPTDSPAWLAWTAGAAAGGTDSTAYSGQQANPYSTVRFDGTADSLSRGANLTGMPTGATTFTFAMRLTFNSLAANQRLMAASTSTAFDVFYAATTSDLRINAADAASTVGWTSLPILSSVSTDAWYTLHIAGDMTANRLRAWVNGSLVVDNTGPGGGTLDWETLTNWRIGINAGGTAARLNADVRFVWFDVNQLVTDPTAFTTGNLGTQGTGTGLAQPLVYFTGGQAVWNAGTNGGTGGNFTMAGAVADV